MVERFKSAKEVSGRRVLGTRRPTPNAVTLPGSDTAAAAATVMQDAVENFIAVKF